MNLEDKLKEERIEYKKALNMNLQEWEKEPNRFKLLKIIYFLAGLKTLYEIIGDKIEDDYERLFDEFSAKILIMDDLNEIDKTLNEIDNFRKYLK